MLCSYSFTGLVSLRTKREKSKRAGAKTWVLKRRARRSDGEVRGIGSGRRDGDEKKP